MNSSTPADVAGSARDGSFTFLDHALWKQFREARSPEAFSRAWLALLCRFIDGTQSGVVVLGEPDLGPFTPVAYWPDAEAHDTSLEAAADEALAQRRGVIHGASGERSAVESVCLAYPVMVSDQLCGVVAMSVMTDSARLRRSMRQLQWAAGWIEVLWRREQDRNDEEFRERTATAFDMVATVLEEQRFRDACTSLVTELAVRLDCDQVSIGFVRRSETEVVALSHAARFGSKMNFVRDLAAAMDEAVDQRAVVHYPIRADWEYRVTREHAELAARHQLGAVLTVPLHTGQRIVGALTFERSQGEVFEAATIEMCDAVASVVGPILEEKRLNDRIIWLKVRDSFVTQLERLIGPSYFGRKIASGIAILLFVFFSLAEGRYRVTSDAVLEGLVQRSVVAPFEGYLASQAARAGETVTEGQTLATLDDRDLTLERLSWATTERQRQAEYDRALAVGDRAEANIIRAQIDQAAAQLRLIDQQLARTRIVAPFEGMIVSGDLSQSVGGTVERGQQLFQITPLDAYRVILEVDERDIDDLRVGQAGTLRIASIVDEPLAYTVERITPAAEQEGGRNFFRVEARLEQTSERMRPGMEGIAKTEIDRRLLIGIWTRNLVDWLRLGLWRWLP